MTSDQAARRLRTVGPNVLASHRVTAFGVLVHQLRNPLLVLLLAAAGVSVATGGTTEGVIIAAIVLLSVGLGFINEYRSEVAVAALHANIRHQALVWRDGRQQRLQQRPVEGDVDGEDRGRQHRGDPHQQLGEVPQPGLEGGLGLAFTEPDGDLAERGL